MSLASKLQELKSAHDQGLISESDYQNARQSAVEGMFGTLISESDYQNARQSAVEGMFGTPLADPRWRKALHVGSLLDALDSDNRWFDARIVRVGEGDEVKVHYMGWKAKWDTWVDRYDEERLAPLHTHTENWREFLNEGDEIEVNEKLFSNGNKNMWYLVEIVEIKEGLDDERQALVRIPRSPYPDKWVSMRSEQVCNPGTHTYIRKKKKASAASSSHSSSSAARTPSSSSSSLPFSSPWSRSLLSKLQELKSAHDQGLTSESEYQNARQSALNDCIDGVDYFFTGTSVH